MNITYYLDNNAIAYLTDRCDHATRERLLARTSMRRIRLFASIFSVEELIPLYSTNQHQYVRQLAILEMLVGDNIFRGYQDIMRSEIKTRNQLKLRDALLTSEEIQSVYAALHDPLLLLTKASQIKKETARQLAVYEELKQSADSKLLPQYQHMRISQTKRTARLRRDITSLMVVDDEYITDWYHHVVAGVFKDIDTCNLPNVKRLPCTRAYISILLASIRRRHGTEISQEESDVFDQMHYAQASYCNVFVSDDADLRGKHDADLRGLLNHLSCAKLKVIDFETFLAQALD